MFAKDVAVIVLFFFSSRRRHTRLQGDWSSDVCSSDLHDGAGQVIDREVDQRCREVHGHPVLAALLPRLADFRARDLDLLDAARPPRAPERGALGLAAGAPLPRSTTRRTTPGPPPCNT